MAPPCGEPKPGLIEVEPCRRDTDESQDEGVNYREIKIRIKDMKWSLSSHQPFTLQTQCHDGLLFFLCLQPDDLIPNLHLFFSLSSPSWFLLHQLSLARCHPCPSAPSSPPTLRPSVGPCLAPATSHAVCHLSHSK